jgi:hypothetical protein
MYVYKILNLQNIIEPETSGEKTYFYVQNKYVVSTNQDISGDNAVELLDLTDELKQELYTLNPITEFSTVLEKQFFIEQLVSKRTMCIKEEAARRINDRYPLWKQSNIQGQAIDILCREQQQKAIDPSYRISEQDKTVLGEAKRVKSDIAYLQEKSNTLEASLSQLSIEELETFNCADKSHWA